MTKLHIGNNSEFVELDIRKIRGADGWLDCDCEIRVRGFSGSISTNLEPTDFKIFQSEVQSLYADLSGSASLDPLEKQFTLQLKGNGRGAIVVSGKAWFVACYGSKLEFEFEIDQTFLPGVLSQLDTLTAEFKTSTNGRLC